MQSRACENCGANYEVQKHWQRFCSRQCRLEAWVLRQIEVRFKQSETRRRAKP
jgi:hypothetical protein